VNLALRFKRVSVKKDLMHAIIYSNEGFNLKAKKASNHPFPSVWIVEFPMTAGVIPCSRVIIL